MEFIVLWLLVVVEKIAALLMAAEALITLGVTMYIAAIVWPFVAAKDSEMYQTILTNTLRFRKWALASAVVGLISWSIGSILPSQKEMAMILGGGVTYNMLTSDEAKETGGKVLALLNDRLDNMLAEEKKAAELISIETE